MNVNTLGGWSTTLLLLTATLGLMGCASGTAKTEAWKFNEETIDAVKQSCSSTFPDARSGTFADLWANKRDIIRQARDCSQAAQTLANMAESRNKVLAP